ncbi:ABC transporter permease [Clostridium hydrogeniformans]|uniref:ABC transporter permease n=1 Tax=Clostridium hydrogeniformans TaxID=349933 RepID=UPI0004881897|nr:ABC transporter permease [Clostridium hydrogeniformans]
MKEVLSIFKKEIMDIFRDKKTIIMTIIVPMILYPVLFGVINYFTQDSIKDVEKGINIGIVSKNNSAASLLKSQPQITVYEGDDLKEKLKKGDISAIVEIPDDFQEKLDNEKPADIKIIVDNDSNKSIMATSSIKSMFDEYYKAIVTERIDKRGVSKEIMNPFVVSTSSLDKPESSEKDNAMGGMLIGMIPSFIVILMISATMAISADLGAGEKERGTLEPLLSTSANRMSILWGKVLALCVIAAITLITSMTAMVMSFQKIYGLKEGIALTPETLLIIGGVSLFVLVSICSLQMAISIYARSMKESNSYLSGLLMPVMILSYFPMMMDAKSIKFIYFNIPVVNAVALMKEAIVGIYDMKHIGIVVAWHILYTGVCLFIAKYMFSKEEVIFRT